MNLTAILWRIFAAAIAAVIAWIVLIVLALFCALWTMVPILPTIGAFFREIALYVAIAVFFYYLIWGYTRFPMPGAPRA